jgi:hypothetical protein
MKRLAVTLILSLLIHVVAPASGQPAAGAEDRLADATSSTESTAESRSTTTTSTTTMGIVEAEPLAAFNPYARMTGMPGNTEPGATRGAMIEGGVLAVLTPDSVALTVAEQPRLYWYTSTTIAHPVEITIVDPRTVEPLLELQITPPIRAGVYRLSLARHGLRLAPGVDYQWNVAVVMDPSSRSSDILSSGAIKRVEPPDGLETEVVRAGADGAFAVYVRTGLWYDALAALIERIDARPDDAALRRHLAALLTQASLPAISGEDGGTGTH